MMHTGEDERALRKIMDMTRLISVVLLLLHFYFFLYEVFAGWGLTGKFTDQLLGNIAATGLLEGFHRSKLIAVGVLGVSLLGVKGRKDDKQGYRSAFAYLLTGLLLYFLSYLALYAEAPVVTRGVIYMVITSTGFLLILSGGVLLTRIIKDNLKSDIFNTENETFPQEERLLTGPYTVNLPACYRLKNRWRKSWINIYTFRALIIAGTPGAGKTRYGFAPILKQIIEKQYTAFVYDLKFPDLSVITYNHWLKNKHRYKIPPAFYVINFDDLSRSNRCNPLDPAMMHDLTDAMESARTILLGLNRQWQQRQGDFFVESAINFLTAVIWFLKKYRGGTYCTLPHVIEFMQLEYDHLFTLLQLEKADLQPLYGVFLNAYLNDVMEQLEGQLAAGKIAMARLSSPNLYYVLSGSDFTLDINNPEAPKILCMGNNPMKLQTYGAVISLYINRLLKIINQKAKEPCGVICDEFPSLVTDVIPTITQGRSQKIFVCLGIQDLSQLRKEYGKDAADVIINTTGNIISGQVLGDSARLMSDRIGRIMQDRQSLSINSTDTSVSKSKQLEAALPPSRIAGLSSGEFVGSVADTPDQPIERKIFHSRFELDQAALNAEEAGYKPLPVIRKTDPTMVQRNYEEVKKDVQNIVYTELQRMMNDPQLEGLVVRKEEQ